VETRKRVERAVERVMRALRQSSEQFETFFEEVMRLEREGRLEEARKLAGELFSKVDEEVGRFLYDLAKESSNLPQPAEELYVYAEQQGGRVRIFTGEEAKSRVLPLRELLLQLDESLDSSLPSCEVAEEEGYVTVVVKPPPTGGEVSARVLEDRVAVTIEKGGWRSYSEVKLPCRVKPETAEVARGADGSLKVTVKKA